MKRIITIGLILYASTLAAQNVGIGTTTPNASAMLEINASNKGLLIPRVNLLSPTDVATVPTPANGLMVINLNSNTGQMPDGAGLYVWTGKWSKVLLNETNNNTGAWTTRGNANTNVDSNFVGTTDNTDLIFKRNNVRAGLLSNTNTSWGAGALNPVTTGTGNTALGLGTLSSNLAGNFNTGVGENALFLNTNGFANTAYGNNALFSNNSGSANTASGFGSLFTNTVGKNNTANGYQSLYSNTSGYSNVAVGDHALFQNTVGNNLVAIGDSSLYKNEGTNNTAVGSKALYNNTTGHSNSSMGFNTLNANISGNYNTSNGYRTLFSNISGNSNTAIGDAALYSNTSGNSNTAVGETALYYDTSGINNTAIGTHSLFFNLNGRNNIAIGNYAGAHFLNIGGSYNTLIGDSAIAINTTNATAIGSKSFVSADNSLVLGSINGTNGATQDTKVGIGVTAPSEKLEIGNGRLRFKGNLTSGFAHGITFTNNAGTTDRAFIGMESDDFLSIYNFAFGAWSVRVHNTSGEVGINKQPLTSNNDSRLQIKQINSQNGLGIECAFNTNHWDFYTGNTAASDLIFYYNGIQKGFFSNVNGAYVNTSDKRLKKDISLQLPVLNNIMQLKAYKYHYLDNKPGDNYTNGFMAQEVQKIFPDAVFENETKSGEKRLGINYQYFTVLAIQGLQEQQAINADQQNQINVLKEQNKMILKELEKLKNK